MSIRAVDVQVLISKTSDVERLQQAEQQQPRINQSQVAAEEVKRKEIEPTLVHKEEQGGKIHEHHERKGAKKQSRGSSGREEEEETASAESAPAPRAPHKGIIDITV